LHNFIFSNPLKLLLFLSEKPTQMN